MREISNSLLKCTKPNISKREKSDLTIWREIFTLYYSNSIFCETRECSCLNLDFRTVQAKYGSFYSNLGAKNYVHSFKFLCQLTTGKSFSTSSKRSSLPVVQRPRYSYNEHFRGTKSQRLGPGPRIGFSDPSSWQHFSRQSLQLLNFRPPPC